MNESLFLEFHIHDSKCNDWQGSEKNVEKLHQPVSVKVLTLITRINGENYLRDHKEQVFVEQEEGDVSIFSIRFSSVDKQQVLKVLKLPNTIVRTGHGMVGTLSTPYMKIVFNTDSNVCCFHHSNIIDAITDRHCNLFRLILINELNDISFLGRGHPAPYQNF